MESLPFYDQAECSRELFQFKNEQYRVEIRQRRRDEEIMKRRLNFVCRIQPTLEEKTIEKASRDTAEIIDDFFKSIQESNVTLAEKATAEMREAISRPKTEFNQVYDIFMESGAIRHLISMISVEYVQYGKLQEDASWALCNFTAGDSKYVEYALKNQIIEKLIDALSFADGPLLANCLWTLANLSSDNIAVRDKVLAMNVVEKISLIIYVNKNDIEILRTAIWLLSNVVGGYPFPPMRMVIKPLPSLLEILKTGDEVVTEHILWTFCYFCEDLDAEKIKFVLTATNIFEYALDFLNRKPKSPIRLLAFRLCSYLVLGDFACSKLLTEKKYLKVLDSYLSDSSSFRRKETCKILSNLVLKYPSIIEKINQMDIPSQLAQILLEDSIDTRIEAMNCLSNILSKCHEEELPEILSSDVFSSVIKNVESSNTELAILSLDILFQILHRCEIYCQNLPNPLLEKFKEMNGLSLMESLSFHKNDQISSRSFKIFDCFLQTPI